MNGTAAQPVSIADIRERLTGLGLLEPSPERRDTFDDHLDRAVRAFQQQRGLVVAGGRRGRPGPGSPRRGPAARHRRPGVLRLTRMYLSPETDARTGLLRLDEIRAALR